MAHLNLRVVTPRSGAFWHLPKGRPKLVKASRIWVDRCSLSLGCPQLIHCSCHKGSYHEGCPLAAFRGRGSCWMIPRELLKGRSGGKTPAVSNLQPEAMPTCWPLMAKQVSKGLSVHFLSNGLKFPFIICIYWIWENYGEPTW